MKCPVYTCQLVRQANIEYKREKCNCTQSARRVIGQIVRPILENSPNEQFLIVTLDTKLKPIGCHIITIGTLDASLVHPREVFRHALLSNASSIILVHNHPSGDCEPSSQDRSVTDRLKRVGELLGITVIDHLIFGVDDNGDFQSVSLAEC